MLRRKGAWHFAGFEQLLTPVVVGRTPRSSGITSCQAAPPGTSPDTTRRSSFVPDAWGHWSHPTLGECASSGLQRSHSRRSGGRTLAQLRRLARYRSRRQQRRPMRRQTTPGRRSSSTPLGAILVALASLARGRPASSSPSPASSSPKRSAGPPRTLQTALAGR